MAATATLNVRLPEDLKRHGGQVLERNGVSVSDAVRALYEHLTASQALPDFMEGAEGDSIYDRRRKLARSMVGIVSVPKGFDTKQARHERIAAKNEGLL